MAKVGKEDKFAVFIDGILKLFLSGQSILDSELVVGQKITEDEITKLNLIANEDQLYLKALRYLNIRLRSEGEIRQYLKRKGADNNQLINIISKLKSLDLIDDDRFSVAFIHDKLLSSPASKRKITYELKKKQIAEDIIERSLNNEQITDEDNLRKLIAIKRNQSKYQDDLKLMQYLVRSGFNYGDVKRFLKDDVSQD